MRVARVAMLSALGIVGRIGLTALPNVQPVTALLILCAVFWSLPEALLADLVVVIVTNLFMGWGIWWIWQLISWAAIAVASRLVFRPTGLYQKDKLIKIILPVWGFLMGFGFGAAVSIFSYKTLTFGQSRGYIAYWIGGLPLDLFHAAGNAVFCLALLPVMKRTAKKING